MSATRMELDEETLERLRKLTPQQALREVRDAVYRAGSVGSEDFWDVVDQLVERGVLTRAQVEEFGGLDR